MSTMPVVVEVNKHASMYHITAIDEDCVQYRWAILDNEADDELSAIAAFYKQWEANTPDHAMYKKTVIQRAIRLPKNS